MFQLHLNTMEISDPKVDSYLKLCGHTLSLEQLNRDVQTTNLLHKQEASKRLEEGM